MQADNDATTLKVHCLRKRAASANCYCSNFYIIVVTQYAIPKVVPSKSSAASITLLYTAGKIDRPRSLYVHFHPGSVVNSQSAEVSVICSREMSMAFVQWSHSLIQCQLQHAEDFLCLNLVQLC